MFFAAVLVALSHQPTFDGWDEVRDSWEEKILVVLTDVTLFSVAILDGYDAWPVIPTDYQPGGNGGGISQK